MKDINLHTGLLTGAFAVIIRAKEDGTYEILTQTRDCREKPEDMAYDNTQECVGERSIWSPGKIFPTLECVLETAARGLQEETRANSSTFKLLGAGGKIATPLIATTGRNDLMMVVDPYTFFQTLEGCRPRFAPVFIVIAPPSFVPKLDASKEVKGFTWWPPEKLLQALRSEAWRFSYAYPILLKLCQDLVENDLRINA